jgi:putative flavoprotein involved in K+ transport
MATVVIGGGQAGLAVSHELGRFGVDHVVLEGDRVAHSWRNRWDSFTLVTPNWTLSLPDAEYDGDDPEGHVHRDEIVAYLQDFAGRHAGPIHEGTAVSVLEPGRSTPFLLQTAAGGVEADTVVVCTGAFQRPHLPMVAESFPSSVEVMASTSYRRPEDLPDGRVLVVGSGQTGIQLSEELHLAGRDVVLACGRAPWMPRRAGGLDLVTWLERTTFFDQPLSALPSPAARLLANAQATGARGGHDMHYRVLQRLGVTLAGRLNGVSDSSALFADDLSESVAFGDARYDELRAILHEQLGSEAPDLPEPDPFVADPPREVDLSGFGVVIFTAGFRPDYAGWVKFPMVFDAFGFPIVDEDLRTGVPGLYFCGVHFLRNRRSSLLWGAGQDARIVAESIVHEAADATSLPTG